MTKVVLYVTCGGFIVVDLPVRPSAKNKLNGQYEQFQNEKGDFFKILFICKYEDLLAGLAVVQKVELINGGSISSSSGRSPVVLHVPVQDTEPQIPSDGQIGV